MKTTTKLLLIIILILQVSCSSGDSINVSGELMTWHKVTLEIPGPEVSELSTPNPFLDYRLEATFTNGESTYIVPGYFAADGNAAETGSDAGSVWKVHFAPDLPGTWTYEIFFREGKNIAIAADVTAGEALTQDGMKGSFEVADSDKTGIDFRAKGRLKLTGGHYLQHAGSGEYFIKGGADSPENFLGYKDFDGTYYGGNNGHRQGEDTPNMGLHAYQEHEQDWHEGDPVWQGDKGKGIIGALNYLSSKGMNSVYFLTLNILGDGEDVWPYNDRNERYRFDCSKLDQWEIVFSHMDKLGLMLHVVLQETENENLLDNGYLDVQRKLYLKELAARFSHHQAITWNMGEEHGPVEWMPYGQSVDDTKKMADYLREVDPYDHFIVMHTHPNVKNREEYLPEYLAHPSMNGLSIQAGNPMKSHESTLRWLQESEKAGQNWIVCIDEIGQHWKGAMPDSHDPAHDTIREHVLWGNLMAGGAGVEWYFGYSYPHADLNCEDWRSRDILWDQTHYAVDFFQKYLPFSEMTSIDDLVKDGYCFAKPGELYALYIPAGGNKSILLKGGEGSYTIDWYNPRTGGELQKGNVETVSATRRVELGFPPADTDKDWVCLVRKQ
jgi:hypothetical protein